MRIISSREFNDHQKLYIDLADQNEQIIVQRGKDKAYMLIPITESDRLSTNPALINRPKEPSVKGRRQNSMILTIYGKVFYRN